MSSFSRFSLLAVFLLAFANTSQAGVVLCSENPQLNRMSIDDSLVSACLASGLGNINGNNDAFQQSHSDYALASKSDAANPFGISFIQDGDEGLWSFGADFWDTNSAGAIAFKFGTGNTPDSWFVFALNQGVTGGAWNFLPSEDARGGGLSHVNLYGIAKVEQEVPEPAGGVLMLLGLTGLLVARRIKS